MNPYKDCIELQRVSTRLRTVIWKQMCPWEACTHLCAPMQVPTTAGDNSGLRYRKLCRKGAPVNVERGAIGAGGAALGHDDCAHETGVRVLCLVIV